MACDLISAQYIEKWLSFWLIEILHAKFQLNPIRTSRLGYGPIKDSAALHGILQCCRVYVLDVDSIIYT